MTRAPTSGATCRWSMYFASRNICSVSAGYGVLGAVSIRPVPSFSCAGMSAGSERDRVEAVRRVPLVHLVVALARVELGVLDVGQRLQRLLREQLRPSRPCPSTAGGSPWPRASARASATASAGPRAASSSLSKKNGMANTLKASSTCESPPAVRSAACSVSIAGPHHADRRRLVALRAAGVDRAASRGRTVSCPTPRPCRAAPCATSSWPAPAWRA